MYIKTKNTSEQKSSVKPEDVAHFPDPTSPAYQKDNWRESINKMRLEHYIVGKYSSPIVIHAADKLAALADQTCQGSLLGRNKSHRDAFTKHNTKQEFAIIQLSITKTSSSLINPYCVSSGPNRTRMSVNTHIPLKAAIIN